MRSARRWYDSIILGKENPQMDISSEDVLNAWLRLTTTVNNVRLAGELPYYELLICGILYRNQKSGAPGSLTATEPVSYTHLTLPTIA